MKPCHAKYASLTCEECGVDTTVEVVPLVPAYRKGHPDNWEPEYGGWIDPEKCECGANLPTEGLPI